MAGLLGEEFTSCAFSRCRAPPTGWPASCFGSGDGSGCRIGIPPFIMTGYRVEGGGVRCQSPGRRPQQGIAAMGRSLWSRPLTSGSPVVPQLWRGDAGFRLPLQMEILSIEVMGTFPRTRPHWVSWREGEASRAWRRDWGTTWDSCPDGRDSRPAKDRRPVRSTRRLRAMSAESGNPPPSG